MSKYQATIIPEKHAKLQLVERDLPEPGEDDILIKAHAAALNPLDWKLQSVLSMILGDWYPATIGTDVAGEVVAVGSKVTGFQKGDRVASFATSIPLRDSDYGAFQEYSLQKGFMSVKLPAGMPFESGAVLPTGAATAAFSLFRDLGIARPSAERTSAKHANEAFLVWGGSSAVGTAAIQLAKAAGFTVYATASPAHHEQLQKLGADHVFDYRHDDCVAQVVQAAKHNGHALNHGFDPISDGTTSAAASQILSQTTSTGSAHLGATLPWAGGDRPDNVRFTNVQVFEMLQPAQQAFGRWLFNEWLPAALRDGTYKVAPKPEVVAHGLKDLQSALDTLKKGVSGTKLVVSLG